VQLLFLPSKLSKQPKSGNDPLAVSGGMARIPALARTKSHLFILGYTPEAFGSNSSIAVRDSSSDTVEESFSDFHCQVDPIETVRGPWNASHASDKIEGL
jgi:hypothetical protein